MRSCCLLYAQVFTCGCWVSWFGTVPHIPPSQTQSVLATDSSVTQIDVFGFWFWGLGFKCYVLGFQFWVLGFRFLGFRFERRTDFQSRHMSDWAPQNTAPTVAVAYERWADKEMVGQYLRALLFRGYEVQQ